MGGMLPDFVVFVLFRRLAPLRVPGTGGLVSDAELIEVIEEPKNFQKPEDHGNDHDTIQYPFDLALHGDKAVHQPQQKPYDG